MRRIWKDGKDGGVPAERERGRLLWEGVFLRWGWVVGVVGAVREPPLRVGRSERGWFLWLGVLR